MDKKFKIKKKVPIAILVLFVAVVIAVTADTGEIDPVIPTGNFPKPPDVPAYVPVPMIYPVGNDAPNPKTPPADVPPAYSYELPSDLGASATGWFTTGLGPSCLTEVDGGPCHEAKFRTSSNVTHVLFDDPIRNYGRPGTSHCHMFFGNQTANAYSTHESLRTFDTPARGSSSAGGHINGTAYWFPCFKVNISGAWYAIPPGVVTLYYVDSPTLSPITYSAPVGLRYVLGYDMDNENRMIDVVQEANVQAGWNRYKFKNSATPNIPVSHSYTCNGVGSLVFKNADGSDPFGGQCTDGQNIQMFVIGPSCWDGVNLWSPGGYLHFIPPIFDTQSFSYICPDNYYRLPKLELNISWRSPGFSGERGYGNWRLDSDSMAAGGAGVLPGYSFHTDWFDGWHTTSRRAWEANCVGSGYLNGTAHECNDSALGEGSKLIVGEPAPDGSRTPQITFPAPANVNNIEELVPLPASSLGPHDLEVHH